MKHGRIDLKSKRLNSFLVNNSKFLVLRIGQRKKSVTPQNSFRYFVTEYSFEGDLLHQSF